MTSGIFPEACKSEPLASRLTRLSSRGIGVELLCANGPIERTPMLLSVEIRTGGRCPNLPPYNCCFKDDEVSHGEQQKVPGSIVVEGKRKLRKEALWSNPSSTF